jgi:PIN domain nuclease of toxin-antitoxin system
VRVLLDTHALLWWLGDDPRLSDPAIAAIEESGNVAMVSAASIWEVEIKRAKGVLNAPDDLLEQVDAARFESLPITHSHAREAARLPRHHNDPFDRMLVAQAVAEQATLVTSDATIPRYGVDVLRAG